MRDSQICHSDASVDEASSRVDGGEAKERTATLTAAAADDRAGSLAKAGADSETNEGDHTEVIAEADQRPRIFKGAHADLKAAEISSFIEGAMAYSEVIERTNVNSLEGTVLEATVKPAKVLNAITGARGIASQLKKAVATNSELTKLTKTRSIHVSLEDDGVEPEISSDESDRYIASELI